MRLVKKTIAALIAFVLLSGPVSAVVIVSGSGSGSYDSSTLSASVPYSLQGSGNVLVFGTYIDNNYTPSGVQFNGVAANGVVSDARASLFYFLNPAASGNVTFNVTAGSTNSAYFIYELSYVDTTAIVNTGTAGGITTTTDNRFIVDFIGANNTDGSTLAPTGIQSLSGVGNANGAGGGGSIAGATAGEAMVGLAGAKTLGWTGFGGGFGQGEVAAAFVPLAGGPVPWNVNGGGNWSTGSNWIGGSQPTGSAQALFGDVLTAANAPATIVLDTPVTIGTINFSNANQYVISGPQTLTLNGAATLAVGLGTHEISANIAGTAGLTKGGGGNLILSGTNTYSGTTSISGGALQLPKVGAVPAASAVNVASTGNLAFVAGYNGAFNNSISGDGGVMLDASLTTGTVSFGGGNSYNGATTVLGGTLQISNASALGSGAGGVADGTTISANGATGNGKLALSGGINVVNELLTLFPRRGEGVADLVHVTSAGSNTWSGNIVGGLNGDFHNFESTSGTLSLPGTISAPDGGAGIRNFVFSGAGNFDVTRISDFAADANGNVGVGSVNTETNVYVTKRGAGKLTIRTASSNQDDFWQGGTVVEGGTLEVLAGGGTAGELWGPIELRAGTILDVDNFTTYAMSEGASLSGGGTVQANTFKVFADNSLSPGEGVGTLTVNGTMQLSDEFSTQGGVLTFDLGNNPATIGGAESDLIQVSGSLSTIGSPDMTVNVRAAEGAVTAGQYRLISHAGGVANVSGMTAQFSDALGNALTVRQTLSVTSAAGQVNLNVAGTSKNLTWTGANGTTWDKNATQNWADSGAQVFFDQDQVTFNDSAITSSPGDFNDDGSVDAADYTIWRDNLSGTFNLNGNGNETGGSAGVVDQADYDLWRANFGSGGSYTINISGADVYPSLATFHSNERARAIVTGTNGFGGQTPVKLTGNVTVALQNTNNLLGTVDIAAGTTLELGGGSTVAGDITGTGSLIINGGANLNSAISFDGPIAVSSQVFPANAQAFGTTNHGTTIATGANVWFNFQSLAVAEPFNFSGGQMNVAGNDAAAIALSGAINVAAAGGNIVVNGGLGDDALSISNNISGSAGGQLTANVSTGSRMTVTGNITNNGTLTKIGTGTLALGATAAITSPRIVVNGGSLDVSAKAALPLSSGQTLSGSFGTVTGNVTAASGSIVRVGQAGMPSGTVYNYTDANWVAAGNTVVASDGSLVTLAAANTQPSALWSPRNPFANGGSILQGRVENLGDSAPTLKTTINGLTPGQQYDVLVNYWTDGSGWQIQAGDSAGTLSVFNVGNSTNTAGLTYTSAVITAEGNRTMWGAPLTLTANGSGQIEVFVDEASSGGAAPFPARTWYDGVSIASQSVVAQSFTISGDLALSAGSTALFDIASSGVSDLLTITGNLGVANGFVLQVVLDPSVSVASLAAGNTWNIFDFASASGSFNQANFILPTGLASGLVWDTSNLLTTGELRVVAGGSASFATNVPEPTSIVLLALATFGMGMRIRCEKVAF
jgi:autotransporter-associated beta strand protein